MIDRPELFELAVERSSLNAPDWGCLMVKDDMLLKMLDALIRAWLETMTPVEIGSDLEKVRILKEARAGVSEGQPSELVRNVYHEVFLRDVWTDGRADEGGS